MAATTAFGLGDYNAALRQVILPYIQDNVPTQTKLLQVLKKNDNVRFFNNAFYFPVRTQKHGGVTTLATDKSSVVTGNAPTTQGSITPKYLAATFDISDVVRSASASDKGAVESAMTFQTRTLTEDFSKNVNRQFWSDGVGVTAQVSGSLSGTTFSIIYPNASLDDTRSTFYGAVNYDIRPTKYLAPGQHIVVGSGGAVGTISAIAGGTSTGTVTLTGATASSANDSIYIVDGDGAGAGISEIQGIRLALSEGTADYAGIARSNDVWSPQYMGTAANQALSLNNMEVIYMSAYEYAQEGDRYAWFMNKSLYTRYGDLLTAMRRTVEKMELTSGWSGLAFQAGNGDVPVMLDFDTPDGEAILLNLDTWTVCQTKDMGFVNDNLTRRPDYITFQEVFSWYVNLACLAPAANGRMVRQTR